MNSKARLFAWRRQHLAKPVAEIDRGDVQIKLSCGGAFHRRRSDEQFNHCRRCNRCRAGMTILLTIGREREIKKLSELVTQQRISSVG
jgi:hypothetical protein